VEDALLLAIFRMVHGVNIMEGFGFQPTSLNGL